MIRVIPVPPEFISRAWPLTAPFIEKSFEYAAMREDLFSLYNKICRIELQLWVALKQDHCVAGAVSGIQDYSLSRVLNLPYIGGDEHSFHEWGPIAWAAFEDYAKLNNCNIIECSGRPGWGKFLGAQGLKLVAHTYEKELT